MRKLIILSLCFFPFLSSASPNTLPFFEGPFSRIRAEADFSGKPFLLYLYQNECNNCQYWEEGPFQDQAFVSYLEENYLITRKNLQTMEGNQLSREFGIAQAGTLLIFSSDGEELERIQDPLPTSLLIDRLKFHISPGIQPSGTPHLAKSEHSRVEDFYAQPERRILPSISYNLEESAQNDFGERKEVFSQESPNSSLSANNAWYESRVATQRTHGNFSNPGFRSSDASPSAQRETRYIPTRHGRRAGGSNMQYRKFYGKTALRQGVKKLREDGYTHFRVLPKGWSSRGQRIYLLAILPPQR